MSAMAPWSPGPRLVPLRAAPAARARAPAEGGATSGPQPRCAPGSAGAAAPLAALLTGATSALSGGACARRRHAPGAQGGAPPPRGAAARRGGHRGEAAACITQAARGAAAAPAAPAVAARQAAAAATGALAAAADPDLGRGGRGPGAAALQRRAGLQALALGAAAGGAGGVAAAGAPSLAGRSAVVTGGGRGIGKGIAVALGELGATVYVTGRNLTTITKTAELVTQAGGRGVPVQCDHSKDEQVRSAFEEIGRDAGGKLDVLVNNAFLDPALRDRETDALLERGAKFYELPIQVWDDVHQVGLRSHYTASYYAAPLLLKAATPDWRPLLCVTSAPAAITYYYAAAYGVAKAGSDRLVRDLQVELGPLGIDCVSIWPGVVLTETVQRLFETGDTLRIERVTGGLPAEYICETPLLTGRVISRLAAEPASRQPPYLSVDSLAGRIGIAAEAAEAFGIRDGGAAGTVAATLYGPDRRPPPSIRSLGYLGPGFLKEKLPEGFKWLAEPDGPLASRSFKAPFWLMAQDPRTEDPRKQDIREIVPLLNNLP